MNAELLARLLAIARSERLPVTPGGVTATPSAPPHCPRRLRHTAALPPAPRSHEAMPPLLSPFVSVRFRPRLLDKY